MAHHSLYTRYYKWVIVGLLSITVKEGPLVLMRICWGWYRVAHGPETQELSQLCRHWGQSYGI